MAVNPTSVWRARPSGSNTNGGGFDCSISSAATGTNGSLSGVTFTDATAAAFTTGMVGSAINISGVGQYLIATRVSATQITLGVGAGGSLPQLSGGAAWTVGAGQDYSQQNAAQASGSHGTATGTTTFIDATANAFTAAMVGNCIQIASGAGFTAGFYFVTAYTSASTVTLDRSPGTGTVAAWALGGGWAEPFTNPALTNGIVPGNTIYVLGSGIPNPASYTYDYSGGQTTPISGNQTAGFITFANDPETPSYKQWPDTTGGMPVIQTVGLTFFNADGNTFKGLYLVLSGNTNHNYGVIYSNAANVIGCVIDQFGYDMRGINIQGTAIVAGCEIFSSVAPGSSGTEGAITVIAGSAGCIVGCNIHDTVGFGIAFADGNSENASIVETIIAKCRGYGIYVGSTSSALIKNCTVDGNLGNGIEIGAQNTLNVSTIINNIISNHTQGGTYGLTVDAGTQAENDLVKSLVDYNIFYNNTSDLNAISYGPHDTHGGSNPYVSSATENYTLV